jgi:hypothetical protein
MIDHAQLANVAEVVSALTVLAGGVFAVIQLREYRIARRNSSTAELMRSFYDPEFARAVRLINQLPDGCTAAELRSRGAEYEEAAIIIATRFETIGLLAFKAITSFSMVRDLLGGMTIILWRKLEGWAFEIRSAHAQASWAEWFQWLAERLAEQGDGSKPPAYVRWARWKPRS